MRYSDLELKGATQIAYLSLLEKGQDALESTGKAGPYTVREIILSCVDQESAKQACINKGIPENEITFDMLVQNSDISKEDKERIELFTDEMLNWKIADINDFNQENGMYACVIETKEDDAIIAFRGSENMKKYQNLVKDWANADFGLLNSSETSQQKAAEAYMESLQQKHILDKYDSLAVTGHSLGGNLAAHFTVSSAEPGRESIYTKINQCVNFDGQGVSNEYIKEHQSAITKTGSKITHYKWSAVGALLLPIPGEKTEFLGINDDLHKETALERFKYKLIRRHDTRSLMFDENGQAIRGKQDIFSIIMSGISKFAELAIPQKITNELFFAVSTVFKLFTYEKEDGGIGFKLPFVKVKEKIAENQFCRKCGDILKRSLEMLKDKMHLFTKSAEKKKSGFSDVATGIQNDKEVRADKINDFINSIGKQIGKDNIEFAR